MSVAPNALVVIPALTTFAVAVAVTTWFATRVTPPTRRPASSQPATPRRPAQPQPATCRSSSGVGRATSGCRTFHAPQPYDWAREKAS